MLTHWQPNDASPEAVFAPKAKELVIKESVIAWYIYIYILRPKCALSHVSGYGWIQGLLVCKYKLKINLYHLYLFGNKKISWLCNNCFSLIWIGSIKF